MIRDHIKLRERGSLPAALGFSIVTAAISLMLVLYAYAYTTIALSNTAKSYNDAAISTVDNIVRTEANTATTATSTSAASIPAILNGCSRSCTITQENIPSLAKGVSLEVSYTAPTYNGTNPQYLTVKYTSTWQKFSQVATKKYQYSSIVDGTIIGYDNNGAPIWEEQNN